jgi:hypothetical protein
LSGGKGYCLSESTHPKTKKANIATLPYLRKCCTDLASKNQNFTFENEFRSTRGALFANLIKIDRNQQQFLNSAIIEAVQLANINLPGHSDRKSEWLIFYPGQGLAGKDME